MFSSKKYPTPSIVMDKQRVKTDQTFSLHLRECLGETDPNI